MADRGFTFPRLIIYWILLSSGAPSGVSIFPRKFRLVFWLGIAFVTVSLSYPVADALVIHSNRVPFHGTGRNSRVNNLLALRRFD